MKTLLLMRHAKSSWKDSSLKDHDRPLKKRGKRDAKLMAEQIKKEKLTPDLIFCSTAERARQTAEIIVDKLKFEGKLNYTEDLYMAEPGMFFKLLKDVKDKYGKIMFIGHNPGMEGVLQLLDDKVDSLPTSAVAVLKIDVKSWSDITTDSKTKFKSLWRPRDFK